VPPLVRLADRISLNFFLPTSASASGVKPKSKAYRNSIQTVELRAHKTIQPADSVASTTRNSNLRPEQLPIGSRIVQLSGNNLGTIDRRNAAQTDAAQLYVLIVIGQCVMGVPMKKLACTHRDR